MGEGAAISTPGIVTPALSRSIFQNQERNSMTTKRAGTAGHAAAEEPADEPAVDENALGEYEVASPSGPITLQLTAKEAQRRAAKALKPLDKSVQQPSNK